MRVLIVSQYFWPEEFRINDLARELRSRGHELAVLTGRPNYPSGYVYPEFRDNPSCYRYFDGIEVLRVPITPRGKGRLRLALNYLSFALSASLIGLFKLRRRTFDVIFVYEPSPVTVALPGILIGRMKKVPVVFWVLDLWPETLTGLGVVRSEWLLTLIRRVVRFIYDNCTLILGQSRSYVESIASNCTDKNKVHYYPSWSEALFSVAHVEKAADLPVRPGVFTIMFAGNIGEAQDMPSLLAAAECLADDQSIRWVIVGDGRQYGWLRNEVVKRGLSERVILAGRHAMDRMPSFYAHADALLVSLKGDAVFSLVIPAKLQTYLMSGLPIIGMLDGEGANVIRESGAGFNCAAGDYAGLVRCVRKMMSCNARERLEMGQRGREYASREFDRAYLISKLESFFHEAIQNHDSAAKP